MSGSIKDYTKYYKFYIPRFDLATWHDYIESNFRSIDALLNDIFSIANYKGEWKNSTYYTTDDVVFIGNDGTQYEGKLCKVLINHTTPGSGTFADYYASNQNKYLVGLSASDAQTYAQNAQTSETNAQNYANLAKDWASKQNTTVDGTYYSARYYANEAKNRYLEAKAARDNALTYSTNASNSATAASNYKTAAQDWARKMDGLVDNTDYSSKYYAQQSASSATNAYNYAQSVNPSNIVHIDGSETITGAKTFSKSNSNYNVSINGWANNRIEFWNPFDTSDSTDTNTYSFSLCFRGADYFNDAIAYTYYGYKYPTSYIRLGINVPIDNPDNHMYIGIDYTSSLDYHTYAPKPLVTTADDSHDIATCGWVNKTGNNVVHLTSDENIAGNKTFAGSILKPIASTGNINPIKFLWSNNKGTTITDDCSINSICLYDKTGTASNSHRLAELNFTISSGNTVSSRIIALKNVADSTATAYIGAYYPSSGDAYAVTNVLFRPSTDNFFTLGTADYRWKQLYAGTATINTSDERVKQQIEEIPEQVLLVWGEVNFYQFKYNDAVVEKGENARLHTGLIAQRIKTVFESHNLDATKYGLLCYDEWEAQEEEKDEEGNIITPAREAGNLYSLRYEECLCMEAAYQRYRADKLEQRLTALEEKLL